MGKNQNAFAKRQREMEKKRKADEKRQRRARRKQSTDSTDSSDLSEPSEGTDVTSTLSSAEWTVLSVFQNHGKTVGQSHHFEGANVAPLKTPLDQLTSKGLLDAAESRGKYVLTERGFEVIAAGVSSGDAEP